MCAHLNYNNKHFKFHILLPFQALAVLYEIDGQYEKAFALYADVRAHLCTSGT